MCCLLGTTLVSISNIPREFQSAFSLHIDERYYFGDACTWTAKGSWELNHGPAFYIERADWPQLHDMFKARDTKAMWISGKISD